MKRTDLYSTPMRKNRPFLIIQILYWSAGLSENPRWKVFGKPIPARADLDVRWEALQGFPSRVWVYRLAPNRFSPGTISNLMVLCAFRIKTG